MWRAGCKSVSHLGARAGVDESERRCRESFGHSRRQLPIGNAQRHPLTLVYEEYIYISRNISHELPVPNCIAVLLPVSTLIFPQHQRNTPNGTMAEQTPLILYRGWPTPGQHVWSPFVIKLEARLRFAAVPYTAAAGSPMTAPRGKIPYVESRGQPLGAPWSVREEDGEAIASLGDSGIIIRALTEQGVVPDLNAPLSAGERAHDVGLRALLEDKLYFYHVCHHECPGRLGDSEGLMSKDEGALG